MQTSFSRHSRRAAFAFAAAIALSACRGPTPFEVLGAPSRSFSIAVGEEITISIGGIGPSYLDPPTMTGSAISYINMTHPLTKIVSPGGAVQLYHFKGISNGQSIIVFHNPDPGPFSADVTDTVTVH